MAADLLGVRPLRRSVPGGPTPFPGVWWSRDGRFLLRYDENTDAWYCHLSDDDGWPVIPRERTLSDLADELARCLTIDPTLEGLLTIEQSPDQ